MPVPPIAPPVSPPDAQPDMPPPPVQSDSQISDPFASPAATQAGTSGASGATTDATADAADDLPPPPPASDRPMDVKDIERRMSAPSAPGATSATASSDTGMDDMDDIPLPPAPQQSSDMLNDASKEYTVESGSRTSAANSAVNPDDIMSQLSASLDKEAALAKLDARPAAAAPVQDAPPAVPVKADLPDFSDDELASLERSMVPTLLTAKPVPDLPPLPEPVSAPAPKSPPKTMRLESEEPVFPTPVNAVAMPKGEQITLPVGITIETQALLPSKFVSSDDYFIMKNDMRAMRKTLRASDDQLKDGVLRHEQLDAQYRRVALDMNNIQDQLMKIDSALFEE